jgi:hypothetical protein
VADDREDTRWLSYAELAEARGTDIDSVARLVRRKNWPKQTGNDGRVRVAVPANVLRNMRPRRKAVREDISPAIPADIPQDKGADITRAISVLDDALGTLKQQLERERAGADHARRGWTLEKEERAAERARLEEQIAALEAKLLIGREVPGSIWPTSAKVTAWLASKLGRAPS